MITPRRSSRWWISRALLCLLLGLVTTIAVAVYGAWNLRKTRPTMTWAWSDKVLCISHDCTLLTERGWTTGSLIDAERDFEHHLAWNDILRWSDDTIKSSHAPRPPPPPPSQFRIDRLSRTLSDRQSLSSNSFRHERLYGWPMRCLWYWQNGQGPLRGAVALHQPSPRTINPYLHAAPGIPYLPIWSGLAANTLLYGAAWATVLAMPLVAIPHLSHRRQRRRLRRGRCPRCNYDLTNLDTASCPECGDSRQPPNKLNHQPH